MPRCQSSSLICSSAPLGPWPALLTTASMRPQRSSATSTKRCRSAGSSAEPVTPRPPSSVASAAPRPDGDRIATDQPSAASRRAAAAPMPLPAAVSRATGGGAVTGVKPARGTG
jgi:hypothetical protein